MSTVSSSSSDSPRPARWPSVSDYNEAVQNLHVSMGDAELRGGTAVPGITGLPMPYAGGFADVYKVECPATGSTWAVKFFKREIRGLRERYRAISEHLAQANLPFMVDFGYLDEGVRIGVRWYPIVKLRWVEGLTLNQFVAQSLDQPRMLDQLIGLWVKVAGRLRAAQIAHADLQHGNVMLVPRGDQGNLLLRLIDYDGMWVPALADRPSGEVGHRHFQHPQRAAGNVYSAQVDRFSHLAICCALRCLSVGGRALWERFDNGDNLLFSESDFASPGTSALFRELWTLRHPDARALVGRLALATQRPLDETPWIDELVTDGRVQPLLNDELRAAQALLEPSATVRSLPVARPLPVPPTATAVVPVAYEAGPTSGAAEPAPVVIPTSRPRRAQALGTASPRALIGALDQWLARVAGGPTQHQMLRAVTGGALLLVLVLGGLSIRWLIRSPNSQGGAPDRTATSRADGAAEETTRASSTGSAEVATADTPKLPDTVALSIGMKLQRIPRGEFQMGAELERSDEQPVHRVVITRDFYLGTHEVTRAQYRTVMGKGPSGAAGDDRPVENVSWNDAQEFCRRLTQREGGALPAGWVYRLPTEAEWEYACRAGTTGKYSFGVDERQADEYAWHKGNANGQTHAVGQKKPNAWGLYDMHGNVWEWCQDPYDPEYYAASPAADPGGPPSGFERVRRGGSWRAQAKDCRSAFRFKFGQPQGYDDLGFRVAAGPNSAASPAPTDVAKSTPTTASPPKPGVSPEPSNPQPLLAVVPFNETESRQHQQAWASYLGGQVEKDIALPDGEKLTLVLIPPGESNRSEGNQPSFRVRLTKPFYLGKYEVTQAQWQAVMGNNPSRFKDSLTNPVENVSWDDIQPFLAKLNASGAGGTWRFDLPTEAQWEYACRAGTTSLYSFGDSDAELPRYGWFGGKAGGKTHPVGQLKPNHFGLYDMHGNVWEWCVEWYGDYATAPVDDPPGPSQGSARVYRGGSWVHDAASCRAALRRADAPTNRSSNYGFRLALSPSGVSPEPVKPEPTIPAASKPEVPARPLRAKPILAVAPFGEADAKQHQQAWADFLGQPVEKEVALPDGKKLTLVLIPAGEFEREHYNQKYRVRLTQPFYLAKYEVTQAQWQAVMGSNPSHCTDSPNNPVDNVSWDDLQPFLVKLNEGRSGGEERFGLPTEAQWEYACRAGTTSAFSFGDSAADLRQYGWFARSANSRIHPVGQLQPNLFGLHDMHGNVWEWCSDWYDSGYYAKAPLDDPVGPAEGPLRVMRGGGWSSLPTVCRSAYRYPNAPTIRRRNSGFRLALSPSGVSPEAAFGIRK